MTTSPSVEDAAQALGPQADGLTMQNRQRTHREHGRPSGPAAAGVDAAAAQRGVLTILDGRSSGMVREVVEDDPSVAGRLAWLGARLTIRPALTIGSYLPHAPWPWGLVDFAARAMTPARGSVRATIRLPHCTARLVRAAGVLPADGTRGVVFVHAWRSLPDLWRQHA